MVSNYMRLTPDLSATGMGSVPAASARYIRELDWYQHVIAWYLTFLEGLV